MRKELSSALGVSLILGLAALTPTLQGQTQSVDNAADQPKSDRMIVPLDEAVKKAPEAPAAEAPAAQSAHTEKAEAPVQVPLSTQMSQNLHVQKMVVCNTVVAKEPVQESTEFDSSAQKLYCWTKVTADQARGTLHHVWYANGVKVGDIALKVGGSPYRTWSYKLVTPGEWKIEATDDNGKVLQTLNFTVKNQTLAKRSKK